MSNKNKLEAELQGIELALQELEAKYDGGDIDVGRYLRLKKQYETRKAELEERLADLERIETELQSIELALEEFKAKHDKGDTDVASLRVKKQYETRKAELEEELASLEPIIGREKFNPLDGCINIRVVIIFLISIVAFSILIRAFVINTESKRTANATQTAIAIASATASPYPTPTDVPNLTDTPSPTPWICPISEGTDEEILNQLIGAEGRAVETKDMDLIRQIFVPQAIVTDASAETSENALLYYERKFETEDHKDIIHTNLNHSLTLTETVVTYHTFGFWRRLGGDFMSYGPGDNRWEFEKIDGCWRVVAFTFNLPPSTIFLYLDAGVHDHIYFPDGWMGDGIASHRVWFDDSWENNPYSGQTSIRIAYNNQVEGWAGIYWLHPANNWGNKPEGGFDLTGADRLTFRARSDTPDAQISFLIGGLGYPDGTDCSNPSAAYPDSVCPKIVQSENLSRDWTKYTIDLHQHPRDWSSVIGGFGWVVEDKITFYLDDIVYEFD